MEGSPMTSSPLGLARPRAESALQRSPIYDLRNLEVREVDGALMISGTVASFYHKQLAQEAVRSVTDGVPLVNTIRVL